MQRTIQNETRTFLGSDPAYGDAGSLSKEASSGPDSATPSRLYIVRSAGEQAEQSLFVCSWEVLCVVCCFLFPSLLLSVPQGRAPYPPASPLRSPFCCRQARGRAWVMMHTATAQHTTKSSGVHTALHVNTAAAATMAGLVGEMEDLKVGRAFFFFCGVECNAPLLF